LGWQSRSAGSSLALIRILTFPASRFAVARSRNASEYVERHPDTKVLSDQTGFPFINYDRDPYADYKRNNKIWLPVANEDRRLPRKAWVLGITVGDSARAYPFDKLRKAATPLRDTVGETTVTIEFDAEHRTARALDTNGDPLDNIQLYWFAWAAFHPDTTIWGAHPEMRIEEN